MKAKTFFLTGMTFISLLFCVNILQAQSSQIKLNQVELMKQWIGSWKWEVAKDTTGFADIKSYGIGLESYFKIVTKGKIVMEGKKLWGYNKKEDKYILAEIIKGQDLELWATWFTSKNKYEWILNSDITNPEKASFKYEGEFKSPDMFIENTIENNKTVKTDIYTRVK